MSHLLIDSKVRREPHPCALRPPHRHLPVASASTGLLRAISAAPRAQSKCPKSFSLRAPSARRLDARFSDSRVGELTRVEATVQQGIRRLLNTRVFPSGPCRQFRHQRPGSRLVQDHADAAPQRYRVIRAPFRVRHRTLHAFAADGPRL